MGEVAADSAGRLIVVLGMHRSGTSAVAGALVAAGAWAGRADELMVPDVHNQLGYFERRSTAAALDGLLLKLGGTWSSPPIDKLEPWMLQPHRSTLRELLADVTTRAPSGAVPLVKDPRLCLFASELATLLEPRARIVLVVRHPIEVARSLYERDGIPIPGGLALWELYNTSVCTGFAARPVHVVRYDQALDDADTLSSLLDRTVGLEQALAPDAYTAARHHLLRALRRHRVAPEDEKQWMTYPVSRLWRQLDEGSRGLRATVMEPVLISRTSRSQLELDADRRQLREQLAVERRRTEELAASVDALRAEVVEAGTENGRLAAELAVPKEQLASALAELAALLDELAGARARIEELASESDAAEAGRLALASSVDALRAELAEAGARNERLSAALAHSQAHAAAVAGERDALARKLAETQERGAKLAAEKDAVDRMHTELGLSVEALRDQLKEMVAENERLSEDLVGSRDQLAASLTEGTRLGRRLAASRRHVAVLTEEIRVLGKARQQVADQLSLVTAERERHGREAIAARRRAEQALLRAEKAELQFAEALAGRDAIEVELAALQRRTDELSEDAATFRAEAAQLEVELAQARHELDRRLADLIFVQDQKDEASADLHKMTEAFDATREEFARTDRDLNEALARAEKLDTERDKLVMQLNDLEERHSQAQHRLLVETDRARGFVESLRSVAGDFHPGIVLEWLDEAELVKWAEMTAKEKERLAADKTALLDELDAVNRHRKELVGDIVAICGSESLRIGRALTWPVRFVRKRSARQTEAARPVEE